MAFHKLGSMGKQHLGSCLCGCMKYELYGDFHSFFLCYCGHCRKDSGSAHAANLFASAATLNWIQGEAEVKTYQHANTLHSRSFCQHCESALPTKVEQMNCIVVPAGSLDSAVTIQPTAKIYVGSCATWAKSFSNVPSYEVLPLL